jgi:hypothetical protein
MEMPRSFRPHQCRTGLAMAHHDGYSLAQTRGPLFLKFEAPYSRFQGKKLFSIVSSESEQRLVSITISFPCSIFLKGPTWLSMNMTLVRNSIHWAYASSLAGQFLICTRSRKLVSFSRLSSGSPHLLAVVDGAISVILPDKFVHCPEEVNE